MEVREVEVIEGRVEFDYYDWLYVIVTDDGEVIPLTSVISNYRGKRIRVTIEVVEDADTGDR